MKFVVLFFCCLSFCVTLVSAQQLSARLEYVFIDSEDQGIYSGGLHLKEGSIKVNQLIEGFDDANTPLKFKVNEIQDYTTNEKVNQLSGKNKDAFVVLKTLDGKKIPRIQGGFTFAANLPEKSPTVLAQKKAQTQAKWNGQIWHGQSFYKSASFFTKGNAMYKSREPFLIMAFQPTQGPDDRQLTFQFINFKSGVGVKDYSQVEVLISGAADGQKEKACLASNWKNGLANTKHTDFYIEFTKWQQNGNKITVSGKYGGTLYGLNPLKALSGKMCDDIVIQDGQFTDVIIELYETSYEKQSQQLDQFLGGLRK